MTRSGFTFIEILVGLSISAAIFLVATSLVVNLFTSTTKSKQTQVLEQVKNDLQAEFSNTVRWADSIAYIKNQLIIDTVGYKLKDGRIFKNDVAITPEDVKITSFDVAKYAASTGSANISSGTGLTGQYFDNDDFTNLVFGQTDFEINFDWGVGSPDSSIDENTFSVRYTGQVLAPNSGEYTFYVQSDEDARLWVDDSLIVDDWGVPGFSEGSGKITLVGGKKYDIRLEYYENFGPARLSLFWSYPGQSKQIIPTSRLYPRSGSVSLEISIDMEHANSTSIVDNLKLILSPRSGDIGTIEP
jgi:prepilin-type N-terminal cleavage/methylation domain-containing protein